jgi:hypothetical protein
MNPYQIPAVSPANHRAILFRQPEYCQQPTLSAILLDEGHPKNKSSNWSDLQENLQKIQELPFLKGSEMLGKQKEQLKRIMEELQAIQANH